MHDEPANDSSEILRAENIVKTFGPVKALKNGSLRLRTGEIHALVGVNGAGKSTLSRIVSGHLRRSDGLFLYKGSSVDFNSPREAIGKGISLVMQETSIAPDLNVMENLCLPSFSGRGRVDWRALKTRAEEVVESLGQTGFLQLRQRAGDLSMAQRQMIEIGRALFQHSDVVIFDEPTASLSPTEVQRLFAVLRRLRSQGKALVFVSHRLEELFEISDCVTIMRDGATIEQDVRIADITPNELVQKMVGREILNLYKGRDTPIQSDAEGPPLLEVRHLASGATLQDVSFTLRAGEILGLGGLVGAGRSETLECIFGLRPRLRGTVSLRGKPFAPRGPREAIGEGLGFIGEDRRAQAIVPDFSVMENLLLAHLGQSKGFSLGYGKYKAEIEQLLADLNMPVHVLTAPVLGLSGGQQQKMIFARWLLLQPSVLLLDEPTRGVDIGTRETIYELIREIAKKGVGVVIVSSDFEELLGMSDRVVILRDGASVAVAASDILDPEILAMFAAPRSSARAIHDVLTEASDKFGASTYWLQIEQEHVFCLDLVAKQGREPGFDPSHFPLIRDTLIPRALGTAAAELVEDGAYASVAFNLSSQSGHSFGRIGLTFAKDQDKPSVMAMREALGESMVRLGVTQLQLEKEQECLQ
jgi:ABC-type sugar transport system ATPase subunit